MCLLLRFMHFSTHKTRPLFWSADRFVCSIKFNCNRTCVVGHNTNLETGFCDFASIELLCRNKTMHSTSLSWFLRAQAPVDSTTSCNSLQHRVEQLIYAILRVIDWKYSLIHFFSILIHMSYASACSLITNSITLSVRRDNSYDWRAKLKKSQHIVNCNPLEYQRKYSWSIARISKKLKFAINLTQNRSYWSSLFFVTFKISFNGPSNCVQVRQHSSQN